MRIVEIMAAGIIGALLLMVGYELGKKRAPEASVKQIDEAALEARLASMVEAKVTQREHETVEEVISRIERLIKEESQPVAVPEIPSEPDGQTTKVALLEKELDDLMANMKETQEKEKSSPDTGVSSDISKSRREPFDPSTLREFEEARRRMMEERRREEEKEEKR